MAIDQNKLSSLITKWRAASEQLATAKEEENTLRLAVASLVAEGKTGKFKKSVVVSGVEYIVNFGTSLSIDKDVFDYPALIPDAKFCFNTEYKLDKKALKACANKDAVKQVVSVLIEKPSMPTIKIKGQDDEE